MANLSVNDRILWGTRKLDQAKPDWRRRIDLRSVRFADAYKSILVQVFGNYYEGRKNLKIGNGQVSEYGLLSQMNKMGDVKELRSAWEQELYTDPSWTSYGRLMKRVILGEEYQLHWVDTNKVQVVKFEKEQMAPTKVGDYKDYDSAKRAVRKLTQALYVKNF